MKSPNKSSNISIKKQFEWRTQRRLRMMSKDYFIPVRPTLIEIRRDKIQQIIDNIKR